jgi:hypothetical protein
MGKGDKEKQNKQLTVGVEILNTPPIMKYSYIATMRVGAHDSLCRVQFNHGFKIVVPTILLPCQHKTFPSTKFALHERRCWHMGKPYTKALVFFLLKARWSLSHCR